MLRPLCLLNSISLALAGTVVWDGRFNDMKASTELNKWSFSNQVGPYQYYIHGPSEVTSYVNLDASFKNPADTSSTQGVKITLDKTAYWNGQNMRRTELIPQTTAKINAGKVFYHFSMQRSDVNPPSEFREHQINFFESHFTEMKSGWISGEAGTNNPALQWMVGGKSQWKVDWKAGVWHNVAYGIDFDKRTVEFYHSTGADALTLVVPAVSASTSSNGADWHLGVLELPRDGYTDANEDFYFSGVYIESGELTTSVTGSGGASSGGSPVASSAPAAPTSAGPVSTPIPAPSNTSTAIFAAPTTLQTIASSLKPTSSVASVVPAPTPVTEPSTTGSAAQPTLPATVPEEDDEDCE